MQQNEFCIISKKDTAQFPDGIKEVDVYLSQRSDNGGIVWTYERTDSKRFINQRLAMNFLDDNQLHGKTIEEVNTIEEPNICW